MSKSTIRLSFKVDKTKYLLKEPFSKTPGSVSIADSRTLVTADNFLDLLFLFLRGLGEPGGRKGSNVMMEGEFSGAVSGAESRSSSERIANLFEVVKGKVKLVAGVVNKGVVSIRPGEGDSLLLSIMLIMVINKMKKKINK